MEIFDNTSYRKLEQKKNKGSKPTAYRIPYCGQGVKGIRPLDGTPATKLFDAALLAAILRFILIFILVFVLVLVLALALALILGLGFGFGLGLGADRRHPGSLLLLLAVVVTGSPLGLTLRAALSLDGAILNLKETHKFTAML